MTQQTSLLASRVGAGRADGGRRWRSVDPAHTGQVVAEVMLAEPATFVAACRAARAAQPGWAATPAPVRGRVIKYLGRLVEENREALARLVTREIGKPLAEARGEVQEIIDTCDFFAGEGRRLYGQTVPSEMPDKQLFTFRQPVGVAAVITAGNFPVAVPSWYLVPALLCGNAVVWKPAECAPATAEALAQLCWHAGLPDGVLNLVQADGPATFEGWLKRVQPHHRVHGSTGTGRITAANPRRGFVGDPTDGLYCHPTIVSGITADDELYRRETFGPIVGVAACDSLEEALVLANGHGFGLSAAVYTRDPATAFRFREGVSAGMVSVNNSTSGAEAHLPFGGNGRSGNGSRQSGIWVLDQFTRWQALNWDYAGKLQKAQMDVAEPTPDRDFRL